MYGSNKYGSSKKFTPRRTSGTLGSNSSYTLKKKGSIYKKSTVNVGYNKNVEKKYFDAGENNFTWVRSTVSGGGGLEKFIKLTSTGDQSMVLLENYIKNIPQGTTVRSRVGNKIKMCYQKFGFNICAAKSSRDQNGETVDEATQPNPGEPVNFMKTTFRIVIVKDLQVNNSTNKIVWGNVFEDRNWIVAPNGTEIVMGCVDNLNIANMGRFIILHDSVHQLDATDPMKCVKFTLNTKDVLRFNGPGPGALTDKGYYVLVSQDIWSEDSTVGVDVLPGRVACNVRCCFADV